MDDFVDDPNKFSSPSSDAPPADLHAKLRRKSPPPIGRTAQINRVRRTSSASKVLQHVMGLQAPEPFVRPPEMPHDLAQRFMAGRVEYGLDRRLPGSGNLQQAVEGFTEPTKTTPAGFNLGKTVLELIREEQESPVKATHVERPTISLDAERSFNIPTWRSKYHAVSGKDKEITDTGNTVLQPSPSLTDRSASLHYSAGTSDIDYGHGGLAHLARYGFGSTATLADSLSARPGSSFAAAAPVPLPQPPMATASHTAQTDPFAHSFMDNTDFDGSADFFFPQRSTSLRGLGQHAHATATVDGRQSTFIHDQQSESRSGSNVLRSVTAPTALFPSPRVEQDQTWGLKHSGSGSIAHCGFAPDGFNPSVFADSNVTLPISFPARPVPHINVQAPSPKKMPISKKRGAPSQDQFGLLPVRTRASDDTMGLPVLDADQELSWKSRFPGNTYALLTVLLHWSLTSQRLYQQLASPYLFSINTAFPYPVGVPVHNKLVSVAFYDTSVTPHKEIRFIGPGDVAEMNYNEVDVFEYSQAIEVDPLTAKEECKFGAMKRVLGIKAPNKDVRHMPMHQRAATGEGRWAYILLQGHHTSLDLTETAPHVVVAWHISAVTDTSECLHTVLPDGHNRPLPSAQAPKPGLKRFASLQNLTAALHQPSHFHHALRSASSSSELPSVEVESLKAQEGAMTLKREVVKMEKPGKIPLIEGFRVDVGKWRGWLDAVGKGAGKVVMWRERK